MEPQTPIETKETAEAVETVETPETAEEAAETPDLDTLLARAEQRGYLRGRNEAIAETRNEPGLWEIAGTRDAGTSPSRQPATILNNLRPGIWD